MLGFGATGQFAIGEVGAAAGAEIITVDKWFAPLSEPPRFRLGLRASQMQFAALPDAFPFVSFGWYEELSKPALQARRRPPQFPFLASQPMPSPFVATGWFAPLSEPPRYRRGLPPHLQQAFTLDTVPIPPSKVMPWFAPLSEPPRARPGLRAALQQFYAAPAQLRPTPTTFGTMSALETKDTFIAAALEWARVVSGEVGVIELSFSGAEVGVNTGPVISMARVAITIL